MKCTLFLLGASLLPAFALAQADDDEADVRAAVPGVNLNIRIKDSSHGKATGTSHQEQAGDGFRIVWDTDPEGGTWFKVLSPEGVAIRVLDDINFPVASGTIPVSFRATGKKFYQVEITSQRGGTFVKKFEAHSGMVAQLWVGAPPSGGARPAPSTPVSPCGSDNDLQGVVGAIEEESFSAGKLRVLEDAAGARGFCVDHAVKILKLYDFEADKLKALKLLAPRLTDRENKFKIYKAFDFDASRDTAKKILQ